MEERSKGVRRGPDPSPAGALADARLRLTTSDGVELHAHHHPGPDRSLCLVLAHGFTNSIARSHVRAVADALTGVGVLRFDFRGHGRSRGQSTVGDAEVLDVDSAVAAARRLGYQRVVTCGFSMGGTCVIRHAAGEGGQHRPDAAIAVSPLARWWYRETAAMRRVLFAIERAPGRAFARLFLGTRIAAAAWDPVPRSPVECIADVEVPLLVVYGDADRYFPVDHGHELLAASREAAELWVEPGMGHGEKAATPDLMARLMEWARRETDASSESSCA